MRPVVRQSQLFQEAVLYFQIRRAKVASRKGLPVAWECSSENVVLIAGGR